MKYLEKYRSFDEARDGTFHAFYVNGFDAKRAGELFRISFGSKVPYKPGCYKFRSFEEARLKNIEMYSRQAAAKAKGMR